MDDNVLFSNNIRLKFFLQIICVLFPDNTQPIKAPEFLKSPKDVEVTEGQMVKFRCKVKGYPPPRITWYKDGKLLKGNSSCKLGKTGINLELLSDSLKGINQLFYHYIFLYYIHNVIFLI